MYRFAACRGLSCLSCWVGIILLTASIGGCSMLSAGSTDRSTALANVRTQPAMLGVGH